MYNIMTKQFHDLQCEPWAHQVFLCRAIIYVLCIPDVHIHTGVRVQNGILFRGFVTLELLGELLELFL